MTPQAEREEGLEYHRIYRTGRQGWGWYAGGILTLVVLFLVVSSVIVSVGAIVVLLATGTTGTELADELTALADTDDVTPGVLLFLNAVIALAIPAAWFCVRVFHGVRPRWLASVAPRIRWKWLVVSFGTAFVTLIFAVVLGSLLPASADAETMSGGVNDFTSTTRDFLLVVVLLTPLQAVGEEYAFRGYLTQAFGGLVGDLRWSRYVAVLGPATLFALAHGIGQSFPIFVDRFAFGIVAGILVIATGGLEAGIAYHVLNNLIAFGLTLAYGDMTSALNPEGGTWWDVLLSVLKSVVFVALSIWAARRMGLQTRTRPGVLEAPSARV